MFNRFAPFKTFSISTSAVRRFGHSFFEFALQFLILAAVILQHENDIEGHAVKDFLTSDY